VKEYLSWLSIRCCCNKGKEITERMDKETEPYNKQLEEYAKEKEPWLKILVQ